MINARHRAWTALLLITLLPGCGACRAQVGYGFGAGATIKVPGLVQTGANFGLWRRVGPDYAPQPEILGKPDPEKTWDVVATWPFKFKHEEGVRRMRNHELVELPGAKSNPRNYQTWMLLPVSLIEGPYTYQHWPLELDLALVGVELRLGFNPYFLFETPPDPEPEPVHHDEWS